MDGYVRVSDRRGRKGPSYISPSEQRDAIARWAEYKQVTIDQWHVDEDRTGGNHERPGLELAVDRATSGTTSGIVVAKVDRFSRMTEHGLRDLRVLREANARLVFVLEDIDTSGPLGRLVYTLMLAHAEYFLEQIKAGWIAAKTRAVERGAYISRTPFGYQRNDDGTISPHPVEAKLVKEAFRLAASSLHNAANYLASHDDRVWTITTTRRMLGRKVYLGKTDIGEFAGDTHDPLVSRAQWEAAQHDRPSRRGSGDFPLTGLCECGTCGHSMVGGHGGQDSKLRVYKCGARAANRATNTGRCAAGVVISADRLERYLRDKARPMLAGYRFEIDYAEDTEQLADLETALADAEHELDQFANDLTARRLLGDRYHASLQVRADAVEDARAELRDFASNAATEAVVLSADALDDPELFPLALRSIFARITIVRGRGLAVEQRVVIDPHEPDLRAGVTRPEDG